MFKNARLGTDVFRIVSYGLGVGSISMIVYTIGPYVEIGGQHPLENYVVREVVIITLMTMFAGFSGFKFWRWRRKSKQLADGITETAPDDTEQLNDRMKDALATLKTSSGGRADYLYSLPWYIIIGPPGSGKTTALVNSGLRFPLAEGATPAAIAGTGGTRYCDWWFTEEAVLIDTAGRYTTQDSDAGSDKKSWLAFLDLLKKSRPRQPINGVLIAISLQDLLTLSKDEIAAHARAIRSRLIELHEQLKVDFPVYALFTKADLVSGFVEFFANLDENARRAVWGATFQSGDKRKNLVGQVPKEFESLIARLNEQMPDRLQEEPAPAPRVALYGFPAQIAALRRNVHDFLNAIFEPTRYHANATLRGFYFTSGTQEGTPVDQLIMSLVRNFGAREVQAPRLSGLGKSFFLTDLIQKVIIGEASWVSTDGRAVRRALIIKACIIGSAALFALGASTLWLSSYSRNMAIDGSVQGADKEYVVSSGDLRTADTVADRDFDRVEPLLRTLRYMPTGVGQPQGEQSTAEGFGLSQRARMEASTLDAYRMGLERLFRPRLLYRLEEVLQAKRDDPSYVYDALKVYLMLGELHPPDKELIVGWMRQDWQDNLYPGAGQTAGRDALVEHLRALLDLDNGSKPLVELSSTIVEDSQRALARLSVAQRSYQMLKSKARALKIPDWTAKAAGGLDADRVFETSTGADLSTVRVPGFFTYAGFQRGLLDQIGTIAGEVRNERWVLGQSAEQAGVSAQYSSLPTDVYDLYAAEFVKTWKAALSSLRLRRLTADKPTYNTLAALAAPSSPLRAMLESIRDETALTKEHLAAPQQQQPQQQQQQKKPEAGFGGSALLDQSQIGIPGSQIEAQFRPLHEWVEGTSTGRPIDQLLGRLNEVKDNLIKSANVPTQAAQANSELMSQLQILRSQVARVPDPFGPMLARATGSFEADVNNSELNQLTRALNEQVTSVCQQLVPGRYPFDHAARSEIALPDFGRLFSPNGIVDRFFQQHLAKYAETQKRVWSWRGDISLARVLSTATLAQFQRAAQIRDTLFPTGGNMPSISLQVFPPVLSGQGVTARFEVNGSSVTTQAGTSVQSGVVQWPGGAASGRSSVTLSTDPQPAALGLGQAQAAPSPPTQPVVLEQNGAWSLFRLLDRGGATQRGDRVVASFLLGGRELQYQFTYGTSANPFTLAALREFRCPSGF